MALLKNNLRKTVVSKVMQKAAPKPSAPAKPVAPAKRPTASSVLKQVMGRNPLIKRK